MLCYQKRNKYWEFGIDTHTLFVIFKTDNQQGPTYYIAQGTLLNTL